MAALNLKAPSARDIVTDAAKQAFDDADGDVRAATAKLEAQVRSDRGLREALTEPLIANACYEAVRRQVHTQRKAVWSPPARTERLVPSKCRAPIACSSSPPARCSCSRCRREEAG